MGLDKAFFLKMKPNFIAHLKILCHPMLIMSLLVLGIEFIQDVMNLLVNVLDVFNKPGFFINVGMYICGFFLCNFMRHDNINQTKW